MRLAFCAGVASGGWLLLMGMFLWVGFVFCWGGYDGGCRFLCGGSRGCLVCFCGGWVCFLSPCCVCVGEGCCDDCVEGEVFYVFCAHGTAFFVDKSLKVLILYTNTRLYRTGFLVILITFRQLNTAMSNTTTTPNKTTTQSCIIKPHALSTKKDPPQERKHP